MEHTNGSHHPTEKENDYHDTAFAQNILPPSADMPEGTPQVSGVEFNDFANRNITVAELLDGMTNTGYQASAVAEAVSVINRMRAWPAVPNAAHPDIRNEIFLGYTSNLVSSGLRSTLRWLVEHRHVTAVVASAGGVEEDLIKCLAPTYRASFAADDARLRQLHINRIGNLRVPNNNYVAFEDWVTPILEELLAEQEGAAAAREAAKFQAFKVYEADVRAYQQSTTSSTTTSKPPKFPSDDTFPPLKHFTPSQIIARLGKAIDNPSSICYWAQRNGIPIFCPALTDGSLGDMLSQHFIRAGNRAPSAAGHPIPIPTERQSLIIDINADMHALNTLTRRAALYRAKLGCVILGAGLVKHHILNACLQGGGADAAVYVNTAQEFDGSDAGARPSEAVSWGKVKRPERTKDGKAGELDGPGGVKADELVRSKIKTHALTEEEKDGMDGQDASSEEEEEEEHGVAVKVYGEATIILPLLVAGSWARHPVT